MIDYHLKPSCSRNQAKYPGRSQTKDLYVLEPDWRLVHTNVMQSLVLWHPARNYQVEVYILSLILAVSVMLYMKFLWVDALIFFFAFFLKDHQLIGMWQRNRSYSNRIISKYLWIFFLVKSQMSKLFPLILLYFSSLDLHCGIWASVKSLRTAKQVSVLKVSPWSCEFQQSSLAKPCRIGW